jgi:Fe2+ transport system protein FeoA
MQGSTESDSRNPTALSSVPEGVSVRVARLDASDNERRLLEAFGVIEGEIVSVLRKAIFGGPFHIRSAAGAEVALAKILVDKIAVEPVSQGEELRG